MVKHSKSIFKNWKLWVGIAITTLIIITVFVFALRNKLTPEETISRFMYLIENKEYEEAKKLSEGSLEKLDVLSNIKPSSLTFNFSEDKKNATSVILENEIESTNMNIVMKNTLLGWRIQSYEVITDLIEPQIIEDRLKQNKTVSDIQLLYWGESNVASKDEIAEYAKDNAMVAIIFAETMKAKNYNKANEMYEVISEQDLSVNNLKEYNWEDYEIINNFKIMEGPKGDFNSVTIKVGEKKVWVYVAGKQIISIKEATI